MNSLSASNPVSPNGHGKKWLRWLPFLILMIAAAVLALAWERIPERWPVHWNVQGQVDKWSTRTPFGVFFLPGLGIMICFMLEIIALRIAANPQSGKDERVSFEAARRIADLSSNMVRMVAIAISIILSSLALVMPLLRPRNPILIVLFAFSVMGVTLWTGFRGFMRGVRELKARGMIEGLEGWNGIIYRNPNDKRLWVPKITGLGHTINFGHRWAWPLMILIISIPLLVVFSILTLTR